MLPVSAICTRTALIGGIFSALLVSSGCSSIQTATMDYGVDSRSIELKSTPFFPQDEYQCGPAALMTVLTANGIETTLDTLVTQVYLPGRQGSLQSELLAASRAAGLVPYELEPSLAALVAELEAGRPVLVLQNLGVKWIPLWHYAVVIGVNPDDHLVILRSGTDSRKTMPTKLFLRTWQRSSNWAIVTLRSEELPAVLNRDNYLKAVTALEETGRHASARDAWLAGLQYWENDTVLLFGLANAEFALENYSGAEHLYTTILRADEDAHVARNNLAMTLAAQGKTTEAIQQIDTAIKLAVGTALEPVWQQSRMEILAR